MVAPTDAASADPKASDLQNYRDMISELAKSANGDVIFNQDFEEAAIIIEYIFHSSQNEVDIITQKLLPDIFGNAKLIDAARNFLAENPDATISIISAEPISPAHPLINKLTKSDLGNRIDLRVMTPNIKDKVHYHLTVGDRRYFRFERKPRPGDVCDAVVQFGEEQIGNKLADAFERVRSQLPVHKKNAT